MTNQEKIAVLELYRVATAANAKADKALRVKPKLSIVHRDQGDLA